MLIVVMLRVVFSPMLSLVKLTVTILSVVYAEHPIDMLCCIILSVFMLVVAMLNVIMLGHFW